MAKIILCFDSYQATGQAAYSYTFQGFKLNITEGDEQNTHRVAVLTDGPNYDRSQIQPLYRFVSALCWQYKMSVYVGGLKVFGNDAGDASEIKRFDRIAGYSVPTGLFEPDSDEQKAALGLYREGKSSDSAFYSFLAFYKIIELKFKREHTRREWINSNLKSLTASRKQFEETRKTKPDLNIGRRMGVLRNGIAHAIGDKRPIDFDGYAHMRELNMLRSLIEELAERVMTEHLGFTKK